MGGGVGKTQHRDRFTAVFWLDGSSKDALRRSMVDAALRLPGNQTSQAGESSETRVDTSQLSESFMQWLSLSDNRNWLLIIDNVDREWQCGSADPRAYDYRDILPTADHGNVIKSAEANP